MEDFADIDYLQNLQSLEFIERRPRIEMNDRGCDMDVLDDVDFVNRYRLQKTTVENLVSLLDPKLRSSGRNNALSTEQKVCLALRFYATGAFQNVVGDTVCVSQPTISRTVVDVSKCLAELAHSYIKLPETEVGRQEISKQFYQISGFPSVYGALDCTHIPIINPGGESERFRCRKGYFSINVQTLCDASLFIRNIVARWPGSTHDSTIFDNSHLRAVLETNVPPIYHVLGDNGYGCRPYLLTPFLDPTLEKQKRYNASHVRARNTVERKYGLWKRRFNCLSIPLRGSLQNNLTVIMATSVLHNIALLNNDISEPDNIDINFNFDNINISTGSNTAGIAKRNAVVENYFNY